MSGVCTRLCQVTDLRKAVPLACTRIGSPQLPFPYRVPRGKGRKVSKGCRRKKRNRGGGYLDANTRPVTHSWTFGMTKAGQSRVPGTGMTKVQSQVSFFS